ncbi:gap junction delta-4 protein [Cebus imitator]|uniref:Gap junction protein n=1 Tax=Cebus imitator TaxID=2715852 RepID=A0A2K5QZE6_CEBIM|nr:gap junction delta-4 protein [Cebus imitator]
MEGVDVLGFLIITLNCNVTVVGKLWLVLTLLLRMLVIVVAGRPVYQDEQERFVCNTLQPGCANVCYDVFSPVSPLRFWLIQAVCVLLPSAVFGVYVLHRGAALAALGPRRGPEPPAPAQRRGPRPGRERGGLRVPDCSAAYVAHLLLRTLLEAAFGALHYLLFGFRAPESFACARPPCSGVVDCYVSRPTEKSLLMLFLWAVSALSFLLGLADLGCSLRRRMRGRPGPRGETPSAAPGRQSGARGHAEEGGREDDGGPAGAGTGGPRGPSRGPRRAGIPDAGESEVTSSASEKLGPEPRGRPHREAAQDPRGSGSEEQPAAAPCHLAAHPSCGRLQPPDPPAGCRAAPHLRARKSEWV